MKHLCVRVPERLFEEARRLAEAEGYASLSELVRHLIREYVEERKGSYRGAGEVYAVITRGGEGQGPGKGSRSHREAPQGG